MGDDGQAITRYKVVSENSYTTPSGAAVRLVYATRQAKVFPVPAEIADAIMLGDTSAIPEQDAQALAGYGVLVPAEEDELQTVAGAYHEAGQSLRERHVALLPTSYCNMGCSYCGQTHVKGRIKPHHRDAVRRRVLRILEHEEIQSVRLDWFGAEPLMAFAVIKELSKSFLPVVDRRGLGWSSVIVTNGALLDGRKIRSLARDCRVTTAEITIDGPPEIHDTHRPLKSGGGSFWRIVEAIRTALDDPETEGLSFSIRTNVDVHNEEHVEEMLRIFADNGLAHPRVRFSVQSVHSWSNDVSALQMSMQRFAQRQIEWYRTMRELGLRFQTVPDQPKGIICPAVSHSGELITSSSDVFSCSEQPLVDSLADTAVGTAGEEGLDTGGGRPEGLYDGWHLEVAQGERSCSKCPLYPVCGGSCPKAWRNGEVACPPIKFNVQGRLDLVAEQHGFTTHGAGHD